jgi:hypothetical protein
LWWWWWLHPPLCSRSARVERFPRSHGRCARARIPHRRQCVSVKRASCNRERPTQRLSHTSAAGLQSYRPNELHNAFSPCCCCPSGQHVYLGFARGEATPRGMSPCAWQLMQINGFARPARWTWGGVAARSTTVELGLESPRSAQSWCAMREAPKWARKVTVSRTSVARAARGAVGRVLPAACLK